MNRSLLFVALSLARLAFSPLNSFAACPSGDQAEMNMCVGDSIDSCHSDHTSCDRQVVEESDAIGGALEQCCCRNGVKRTQARFKVCKADKIERWNEAKSLFSNGFQSKFTKDLNNMSYRQCNFPCDF